MILDQQKYNVLFWIVYSLLIIGASEIFAYFWHRFGAHGNYVFMVHDTHFEHHTNHRTKFNYEAEEDFVWILLLMTLLQLVLFVGVAINLIPAKFALISGLITMLVFSLNWKIHRAYHVKDHWLNRFSTFKRLKELHYVHHKTPTKNYGILSLYIDWIMGTFKDTEDVYGKLDTDVYKKSDEDFTK